MRFRREGFRFIALLGDHQQFFVRPMILHFARPGGGSLYFFPPGCILRVKRRKIPRKSYIRE